MPEEKNRELDPSEESNELAPLVLALHGLQEGVIPYLLTLRDGGGYLAVKAGALRKLIVERIAKQL